VSGPAAAEIETAVQQYSDLLSSHLRWEEDHLQAMPRKYIPLALSKEIIRKVCTDRTASYSMTYDTILCYDGIRDYSVCLTPTHIIPPPQHLTALNKFASQKRNVIDRPSEGACFSGRRAGTDLQTPFPPLWRHPSA
jgi:hypothetical protein